MKLIHKRYLKTISLTWGASLGLFLLAYVVVLGPQGRAKSSALRNLVEQEQAYKAARKATEEQAQERLKEQLRHLSDKIEDFVVAFDKSANLTFDISRMANEREIESFNIKNEGEIDISVNDENRTVFENSIEVTFSASFNQFASLLNALERYKPVVFVDSFNISPPDINSGKPQISMNLVCLVRKEKGN
jgi:hypothetical protein